jgi:hypothetical protein
MTLAPTKVVSLRLDTPELDELDTHAIRRGLSRAALMTAILVRWLQQNLISATPLDRARRPYTRRATAQTAT